MEVGWTAGSAPVPGIHKAHLETLEHVLCRKVLGIAMEVAKSHWIRARLLGVLHFDDNSRVWIPREEALDGSSGIKNPSDEELDGVGAEVLASPLLKLPQRLLGCAQLAGGGGGGERL